MSTSDVCDLDRLTAGALLEAMASDAPSPGAGAAGALALALGAACAAKAFALSARHGRHGMAEAAEQARGLSRMALAGACWDAADFPDLLRSGARSAGPSHALRRDAEAMLGSVMDLRALLTECGPEVMPAMAGDLLAAHTLLAAGETVVRANLRELGGD